MYPQVKFQLFELIGVFLKILRILWWDCVTFQYLKGGKKQRRLYCFIGDDFLKNLSIKK